MKELEQNIKKMYLYQILNGMVFVAPIFIIFVQENGLTLTQAIYLQAIFAFTVVLFEVPSGYFADLYGRRQSLVLGSSIEFLGLVGLCLSSDFWSFFISELFIGVGIAFLSGANMALVYDTLKELGRTDEYKEIWGNITFYNLMSVAFSSIVGGLIASLELRFTVYASLPFYFILIPLAYSLKEPKRTKVIVKKGYAKELWIMSKTLLRENKKLRWIIVYSAVIMGFNQTAFPFYQDYFRLSGLDIVYFGVVFASFQVVAGYSSKYAHKIESFIGDSYSLVMLTLLVSVSYLLMSQFIYLFSFTIIFLQQFIRGFRVIVVTDYINRIVDSEHRATILSIESFLGRFIYGLLLIIFGGVIKFYSMSVTLFLLGVLTFVFGGAVLLILKRNGIL